MIRLNMRTLLGLLIVAAIAHGQTLDESARALSKKVAARLGATEAVKISAKNLTSLPSSDLTKAQSAFARGLRKNGKEFAEITLTISANAAGFLLIAEMRRGSERMVDMLPFEASPVRADVRPVIQKSLVWEQDEAILDVSVNGDAMAVLGARELTHYKRVEGKWQRGESTPVTTPPSRDPRGQINPDDTVTILAGNTFQVEGWPAYYTRVHWRGFDIATEPDGLAHLYDALQKQVATIDAWGSDIALAGACGVVATSPSDDGAQDSVALWDVVDRKAKQVSEAMNVSGAVTALWAEKGGVLAVVQTGKRYAAYLLTIDCPR